MKILVGLLLIGVVPVALAQDYTNQASSFAVGGISTNGDYTNISSWQQPVNPTQSTGGEYVNQSGFMASFIEQGESDVDGDGLVDSLDPDNDNDGIVDLDEITGALFIPAIPTDPNLGDSDYDGSSDYNEFMFGFDPTNPDSRFQIATSLGITNPDYELTIQTISNRTYRILFTDALTNNWSLFTNQVAGTWLENRAGTNICTFVDDFTLDTSGSVPAGGARFYRVSVEMN